MASESTQTDYFNIDLERESGLAGDQLHPQPQAQTQAQTQAQAQQTQVGEGESDTTTTTTQPVETLELPSVPSLTFQMKTNRLLTMRKVYQRTPPFPCNWPSLLCMFVEINSLEKELAREQGVQQPQQESRQSQQEEDTATYTRHPDTPITHRIQRSPAVSNLNEDSLHIISPQTTPDTDSDEPVQLSARERIVKTEKAILEEELEYEDKQKKLKKLTYRLAALRHRNSNEHHQKYVTLLEDIIVEKSFEPCAICLDHPDTPSMTPCGHIFCATCINDAVNHQSIIEDKWCPVCRDKMASKDLVEIPTDWKLTKMKPFPWPWNWGKPPQLEIL